MWTDGAWSLVITSSWTYLSLATLNLSEVSKSGIQKYMKSKVMRPAVAIPGFLITATTGLLLLPTELAYLSAPLGLTALVWFCASYVTQSLEK